MEGVGGCPKFIVLSTGPLSVPNYYTIITQPTGAVLGGSNSSNAPFTPY